MSADPNETERSPRPSDYPKVQMYGCSRCSILSPTDGKHMCQQDDEGYSGYDLKVIYLPDRVVWKS